MNFIDILIPNLIMGAITSIIWNVIFYYKSAQGTMDVEWNEEKQVYNAQLHVSNSIDYSKKKQLILKINSK